MRGACRSRDRPHLWPAAGVPAGPDAGDVLNAEQQDLHLVKHVIHQYVKMWEQELNLKLFPFRSRKHFVQLNVDGLLRGDFESRMEGYAFSIQNAVRTPNEVRALENLEPLPEGDDLLIQSATVPLGDQGKVAAAPPAPGAPAPPPPGADVEPDDADAAPGA